MSRQKRYRDGIDGGILDDDRLRIIILGAVIAAAFAVLTVRLYYLQLHKGEEHSRRIAGQSIRYVRQPGMRGTIYTADNVVLAGNRITYDLVFYPSEMRRARGKLPVVTHMVKNVEIFARALGRSSYPDADDIRNHINRYPGIAMTVFRDLTPQEMAAAFVCFRTVSGADIQQSYVRTCPEKSLACGIIGFVRNSDPATASDRSKFRYYIPDLEGRSGVEKFCDSVPGKKGVLGLRSYPGHSIIQVNSLGYAHRELLGRTQPVHGSDVYLTLENRAQKLAERLLAGYTGAMVVVDADNGDVLCAASSPGYDLSRFYPTLSREYFRQLHNDPGTPLVNRALTAIYPPGSTLKPLICIAMLKNGINPDEEYFCEGAYQIGNASIRCSAHRYAGAHMTMVTALEKSCNSYMIHHALTVGREEISEVLKNAGIGRKSGLELPESAGDFPSPALKERRFRAKWNSFDTALLSIGQGMVTVTPLQMALYTAAIANGGTIYQPHLVREIVDGVGITLYERKVAAVGKLGVSAKQLAVVQNGMFQVVNSSGGSGRRAAVENLNIYGKTGTAEIGPVGKRRNITHFVAYVTYKERTYAAAVTVEDGASGGRTCAPLMAAFFEHYLLGE